MGSAPIRPYVFLFNIDWFQKIVNACPIKQSNINLQTFKNSYCTTIEHLDKEIGGICINRNCQAQDRKICLACVIQKLHAKDPNHDPSDFKTDTQINQIIDKYKEKCYDMLGIIECDYWIEELKLWDLQDKIKQIKAFIELNELHREIFHYKEVLLQMNVLTYLQFLHQNKGDLFSYLDHNYKILNQLYNQMESFIKNKQIIFQIQIDQQKQQLYQLKLENMKKNKLEICQCIQQSKLYQENLLDQQRYNFITLQIALLLNYAKNQSKEGRYEIAFQIYDHIIKYGPSQEIAHLNYGKALHQLNQYTQAITQFEKAIEKNKKFYKAYYSYGKTLIRQQIFIESDAMFRKVLEINPEHAKSYNKLGKKKKKKIIIKGNSFLRLNDYKNSFEMFIISRDLAKKKQKLEAFRIKIKEKLQVLVKAKEMQDKDRNQKQNHQRLTLKYYIQIQKNLVQFVRKINPEYFNQYLQQIPQQFEQNNQFFSKGLADLQYKRFEEASDMFEKSIIIDPNNASGYKYKGIALMELKQYQNAINLFETALTKDSTQSDIYKYKRICKYEQNQHYEQINLNDQLLQIDPKNPEAYNNKANTFVLLQFYEDANEMYEKATKHDPDEKIFTARCSIQYCNYKINNDNHYINEFKNTINQYIQRSEELKQYGIMNIHKQAQFYIQLKEKLFAQIIYESIKQSNEEDQEVDHLMEQLQQL